MCPSLPQLLHIAMPPGFAAALRRRFLVILLAGKRGMDVVATATATARSFAFASARSIRATIAVKQRPTSILTSTAVCEYEQEL